MAQRKLPNGFQFAEELSPSEGKDVDLRRHEAPKRQRQPGEPEVWNLSHAFDVFRAHVAGSRKINDVTLTGARVGGIFAAPAGVKYLVLYKRARYRFFSRHFPSVPERGHGVIANMKLVHWSALEGIRIATVFPDGSCYWIKAMDFWKYYEKYGTELTKLPGEIATPFSKWTRLF